MEYLFILYFWELNQHLVDLITLSAPYKWIYRLPFIPENLRKPKISFIQSFVPAQFSRNNNCLLDGPRRIALPSPRPVIHQIRALPSDGPWRFRTAPDRRPLAPEKCQRMT